jgi:hypothetical protein
VCQPPPICPVSSETDLRPEDFGCVPDAANDAKTARIGDSSSKFRPSSDVHTCSGPTANVSAREEQDWQRRQTCEEDGVLDAEELGQRRRDGGHVG